MEKIDLSSRYNDVLTELEFISENSGIITTNGEFIRTILKNESEWITPYDTIFAIDYEGGPMISVGSILEGRKVKRIRNVRLIEFEE